MPSTIATNQRLFLKILLRIAYNRAALSSNNEQTEFTEIHTRDTDKPYPEPLKKVGFDCRGRAIFDLVITPLIVQQLLQQFGVADESTLKKAIGINYSPIIRCHLSLDPQIQDEDIEKDLQTLNDYDNPNNRSFGHHLQCMSIIPLYEELLCNIERTDAAVRAQIKQCSIPESKELSQALDNALESAREAIQAAINLESQAYLKNHPTIDISKINKQFDKERSKIVDRVKNSWLAALKVNISSLEVRKKIFEALAQPNFSKIYAETPAHQQDILATDGPAGMVSYITNSGDRTFRNKDHWAEGQSPLRFLIRHKYLHLSKEKHMGASERLDEAVRPRSFGQISARVSSPADLRLKKEDDILRIVAIYKSFHEEFDKFSNPMLHSESKEGEKQPGKPIVYHLLSALDPYLEERRNKSKNHNESTRRILAAAHRYNKEALSTGNFLWVQNISADPHSNNLGEWFALPVHKEVTLMADIALLYTLQDNINNKDLRETYGAVLTFYKTFLRELTQSSEYFYKSRRGIAVSQIINACKNEIAKQVLVPTAEASPTDQAHLALVKIFIKNYHYKKYGPLTQALSIFVEKRSVAGCSTGNKWHEDVQKRTGFLILCESRLRESLNTAYTNFIKNPKSTPHQLNNVLEEVVNTFRMYGDESAIGLSDEGSPAHLKRRSGVLGHGLLWLGKALFGLATASAVGLAAAIIGFTTQGTIFSPFILALVIFTGTLGLGVIALHVPKLWNLAKFSLGLSSLGLIGAVGAIINFGLLFSHPLGFALAVSVAIVGLAVATSAIGGYGLKAFDINRGCSPLMTHYINDNTERFEAQCAVSFIRDAAKLALKSPLLPGSSMVMRMGLNPRKNRVLSLSQSGSFGVRPMTLSCSIVPYVPEIYYEGSTPSGYRSSSKHRIVPDIPERKRYRRHSDSETDFSVTSPEVPDVTPSEKHVDFDATLSHSEHRSQLFKL